MSAQQLNVEVISNNIANMNTVGFKRQRAEFQDLMYQNVERAGAKTSDTGTVAPTGIQIGAGVKAGATYRISEQGAMTKTENRYDLALDGKGFFQVLMPSGETAYTRAGNFGVDNQGRLVTDDGYVVQPEITIAEGARDVSISKTGQVQVILGSDPQPQEAGQIQLATFINEAGLEAIGDNLLMESGASGAAVIGAPGDTGFATLMQGYTEASNVDAVSEVTALIVAQRAYEMNSKVITTADEMLSAANQLKQ
jgi:flagellar basal-body rod protein FlgG